MTTPPATVTLGTSGATLDDVVAVARHDARVVLADDVLETVIGRTVKFPDASVSGVPITQFAPEHAAAQAYLRLARELVDRGEIGRAHV